MNRRLQEITLCSRTTHIIWDDLLQNYPSTICMYIKQCLEEPFPVKHSGNGEKGQELCLSEYWWIPSTQPAHSRYSTDTSEVKNWNQFFCVVFSIAWIFFFTWNHTIIIMGQRLEAIFTLEKSIYILYGKNHAGFLTLFEIHWITAQFPILPYEGRPSPT